GCTVLHHTGFEYNKMNMDYLLETRHMSSVIRRGGGRTKGPKALSQEDKNSFLKAFQEVLASKYGENTSMTEFVFILTNVMLPIAIIVFIGYVAQLRVQLDRQTLGNPMVHSIIH